MSWVSYLEMETKQKKKNQDNEGNPKSGQTKVKKETKHHKRGLLDILEIHACAGSEIGTREKISKDVLPYVPSQKSMPTSSLSEVSDVNIPEKCVLAENKKRHKHRKKKVKETYLEKKLSNLDETKELYEVSLETLDDQDCKINKIYAGCDPFPTKQNKENIKCPDILLEKSDDSLLNINLETETMSSFNGNSYRTLAYSKNKKKNDIGNQNYLKNPNRNIKSFSVFSSRDKCSQNSVLKKEDFTANICNGNGDGLINMNEIYIQSTNHDKNKIIHSKSPENSISHLLNRNNYSLTAKSKKILQTPNGENLVLLKNRQRYSSHLTRLLYEKNCESSNSLKFFPDSTNLNVKEIESKMILFDFRGCPLTDSRGEILTNANGEKLVITDHCGKLLHDINGNPIFDQAGIPLTKKNNCWLNPRGTPYRVFNASKFPLTGKEGITILDRKKVELLKCDKYGRPVFDYKGNPVCDANGYIFTHPKFNPTIPIESEFENVLVLIENTPVKVYDKENRPLTDSNGTALKDADGKFLLNLDFILNTNQTVVSGSNTILSCRINDARDNSFYSFSSKTTSLTNIERTRRFNLPQLVEKPLTDNNGEFVYDSEGQQILIDTEIYATPKFIHRRKSLKNSNLSDSIYTMNSKTSLPLNTPSSYSTIRDENNLDIPFEADIDIFGRQLYNEEGTPLFDKYGRPIWDLFQRPLYDSKGCPIATAHGKLLSDGSPETPGFHPGFHINYLKLHDPERTLNLTDRNGSPIHDASGQPMYNINGKPFKDAFGRPLYDEHGYPLCDEKGLPSSKAIKEKGLEIAYVTDKFQKLTVSSKKHQIPSNEGTFDGGSKLKKKKTKNDENESVELFNARLRLTTFDGGETVVELLEIVPSF